MPDKRIYNFQIPRTTPTIGLKKVTFLVVNEVHTLPLTYKTMMIMAVAMTMIKTMTMTKEIFVPNSISSCRPANFNEYAPHVFH